MAALPPEQSRAMREAAQSGSDRDEALAAQWATLHVRASEVARLAELSPEPFTGTLAAFPEEISQVSGAQHELVRQAIEDIEAMMRPGLVALETLRRRGVGATAPALALWREFYTARGAVLALARP